nr:fatty acid desaturase [Chroococcidiopsis sp. SAG 2025]
MQQPITKGVKMIASEAKKPLTVPKEFLAPPEKINPDVWMFLVAMTLLVLSNCGYWLWEWQHWCCFTINVLAIHMSGTVIHDACHQAAHPNRIINAILGHGSAMMLAFSFPVFTRVHLQHHAHVNDPENDPDHFVSTGGPLWLINARFFYHEVFFFQRRLWRKYELLEWFISRAIVAAIFYISIQYHFLGYILNFWFIPTAIVGLTLGLFFDYLPHRPFSDRGRWTNARVYPNPVLNLLIGGQNYHLTHHLWPSIPWYKYQPAYHATKHLLDAKGSPQTLGIWQGKDFWSFLYDVFLGIRLHRKERTSVETLHVTSLHNDQ